MLFRERLLLLLLNQDGAKVAGRHVDGDRNVGVALGREAGLGREHTHPAWELILVVEFAQSSFTLPRIRAGTRPGFQTLE